MKQPNHPYTPNDPMMTVNYGDENHLIYTLSGVDVTISMVTGNDQLMLIDSALKAGVTRFIPAEFAGSSEGRNVHPTLDRGQRLAQMRLRDHVAEGMKYTVLTCGLLYERLGPDGLRGHGMGNRQGANGEGDFLIDLAATSAQIPVNQSGQPATVCMTSIDDVARFLVAALEIPNWPRRYHLRGERLRISGEQGTAHPNQTKG